MRLFLSQIESFKKKGAIGIICSPRDYGVPGNVAYGSPGLYDIGIPIGIVSRDLYDHAKMTKIANFSFHGWDDNPWYFTRAGPGNIIFSVVIGLLYLFNICLSGYRLAKWIYLIKGIDYTLGFLCLSLEFLYNFLRVLQIIFYGTYNNFALNGADLLVTLPWCITTIISILIIFFWLDFTGDPFYHGKFLGIMKIPAVLFIAFCLVLEILCYILRLLTTRDYYNTLIIFYSVSLTLIVIFNFTAAYRIIQPLQNEIKETLRIIIYRVLASGISIVIGVIVFFLFFGTIIQTPNGWLMLFFVLYFFFWLQSVLLILIFNPPPLLNENENENENEKETVKKDKEIIANLTET